MCGGCKKQINNAIKCVNPRRITDSACVAVNVDDVMYDEPFVFVDIAYAVAAAGAVLDAECVFEAPATDSNIMIANYIQAAIMEQFGIMGPNGK